VNNSIKVFSTYVRLNYDFFLIQMVKQLAEEYFFMYDFSVETH